VAVVSPPAVHRNLHPPPVVVTGLSYVSAKGTRLESSPLPDGGYPVAAGTRSLTVQYAILTYCGSRRAVAAVRLERDDQVVLESRGSGREATFGLLPHGNYTVRITAANADGVWNHTGTTVRFRVTPFFWQTPWFRVGGGVLVGGLISGVVAGTHLLRLRMVRGRTTALWGERQRISRELHDGAMQMLLAAKLRLQLAREQMDGDRGPLWESINTVEQLTRQTLAETRAVVWDLRHRASLDSLLENQLRAGLENLASGPGLKPRLTVDGKPWPVPLETAGHLRRVAMEAVANALRHAKARSVQVRVEYQPSRLAMEIHDDGQGFDVSAAFANGGDAHFGLISMRERATTAGATFQLESAPDRGTTVRVSVQRLPTENK
jgi:two-component sensor histidine kinase